MRPDCQAIDLLAGPFGSSMLNDPRRRRGAVDGPAPASSSGPRRVPAARCIVWYSMRREETRRGPIRVPFATTIPYCLSGRGHFPRRRIGAIQGGDMFQKTSRLARLDRGRHVVPVHGDQFRGQGRHRARRGADHARSRTDRLSSSGSSAGVSSCCSRFPGSCSDSRPRASRPGGCWRCCRSYGRSHSFHSSEP